MKKRFSGILICILFLSLSLTSYAFDFPMETNVSIDKEWTIKFNMSLDPTSVNSNNIYIRDWNHDLVNCSVNMKDDNSAVIRPLENYEYGKSYTLYVGMDVRSKSNKHLDEKVIMDFTTLKNPNEELLKVYYFDVGQGDSIYIKTSNGDDILIDGGDNDQGDRVVKYLKDLNVDDIEG